MVEIFSSKPYEGYLAHNAKKVILNWSNFLVFSKRNEYKFRRNELQKGENIMEILKGSDIANGLKQIKPRKIAVAFIGSDYDSYLDDSCLNALDSIILSPTEGSNPKAISKLVKSIGWEKVHFLSRLHAKIYIGEDETIIGSSNLSRNGLIGDCSGLYEVCVKTESRDEFDEIFNEILNEAHDEFPDEQSKQKALDDLYRIYNKRKSMKLEQGSDEVANFKDYDWNKDEHFYLTYYGSGSGDYTEKSEKSIDEGDDEDSIPFIEDDEIFENRWVLYWKCQNNGNKVNKRTKPSWLYIDKIIPNGFDDGPESPYTKLAIQLKSLSSGRPLQPFEITKDFIESFRNVIEQEKYEILFNDNPYVASSEEILGVMSEFLADIKKDMMK